MHQSAVSEFDEFFLGSWYVLSECLLLVVYVRCGSAAVSWILSRARVLAMCRCGSAVVSWILSRARGLALCRCGSAVVSWISSRARALAMCSDGVVRTARLMPSP